MNTKLEDQTRRIDLTNWADQRRWTIPIVDRHWLAVSVPKGRNRTAVRLYIHIHFEVHSHTTS